jgi:hypothetical protein
MLKVHDSIHPSDAQTTGKVQVQAELPPHTELEITIEAETETGTQRHTHTLRNCTAKPQVIQRILPIVRPNWLSRLGGLPWAFVLALSLTLLMHFVALDRFPIYFFTDEAIQTMHASDLLHNHLRVDKEYLPTYFVNGDQYNLSVSVYVQVLPALLLPRSIWVTRGVSVILSLLASLSVGLIMRDIFQAKQPWLATMLLGITPAWFLHSRTAFETVLAVSFYAAFLYAYLRYRCGAPHFLYLAILCAALSFYSYSPAQLVITLTAALLFFSDLRYHWQQRAFLLRGLGLLIVLSLPYLRHQLNHPGETARHMQILNSYWIREIPLTDKLGIYFKEYLRGLDLRYWYWPNNTDLMRHKLDHYGHVLRWTLPLFGLGLSAALWKGLRPASINATGQQAAAYRTLLLAMFAAPSGAALVQLGITRALFMVIPLCLFSALGVELLLGWLTHRRLSLLRLGTALAWLTLTAGSIYLLQDSLRNGPLWFQDYGLGGMQYGAQPLFSAVRQYLEEHPGVKMIVSPSWSNGTDIVARFFFEDPLPFQMGSVIGHIEEYRPLDSQTVFVVIPEEYKALKNSDKFSEINIEQILNYPNGEAGFYFLRLRYVDNAEALFAAEAERRRELQTGEVLIDGETVPVRYSTLDMAEIGTAFDGDPFTLLRTRENNPMRILLDFPSPRQLEAVSARLGGVETRLTVLVYGTDSAEPLSFYEQVPQSPEPRWVTVTLPQAMTAARLEIQILNVNDGEIAHVHLWEVKLK